MREVLRLPLRVVVFATVLAFAAATLTYAALSDDGGDEAASAPTIDLEPDSTTDTSGDDASFTTFDGDVVALSSLRGKPVVVNFFASTCVPCVREMPAFEEVFQQVGDDVAFLGLAMQDRPEEALALVDRTGVTYPTAQDKDGSVITALGGTVLPTTVLLDAEGNVVTTHAGELDADELRELLSAELGITA